MTLRDEHLTQALKHAPDANMQPEAATRRKILEYAAQSNQPKVGFWRKMQHWLDSWNMNAWQLAGLGSAMGVFLAMLILHYQTPTDFSPETSIVVSSVNENILKPQAVPAESTIMGEDKIAPTHEANSAKARSKTDAPLAKRALTPSPAIEEKLETPASAPPIAADMAKDEIKKPMPREHEQIESAHPEPVLIAQAESAKEAIVAAPVSPAKTATDASVTIAPAPIVSKQAANSEIVTNTATGEVRTKNKQTEPGKVLGASNSDAQKRGIAQAKQDIQAGMYRILHLANSWPSDKTLLDDKTGYRVELVKDKTDEEIEAYNQTMRVWHHQNSQQ